MKIFLHIYEDVNFTSVIGYNLSLSCYINILNQYRFIHFYKEIWISFTSIKFYPIIEGNLNFFIYKYKYISSPSTLTLKPCLILSIPLELLPWLLIPSTIYHPLITSFSVYIASPPQPWILNSCYYIWWFIKLKQFPLYLILHSTFLALIQKSSSI